MHWAELIPPGMMNLQAQNALPGPKGVANIAAAVHQDHANVKGAVNIIITKRRNSTGGNLHVPEFGATFDQVDGSMLVYPAYRNRHGVTPIVPTHQGGYRNSHVWYALDSFASL